MTPQRSRSERRPRLSRSTLVPGALVLGLAVATRAYRLTYWPLAGDEFFTITDSRVLAFKGKPLLFWLNHYLVDPLLGLDVLGVRLLPAVFGILGILFLFWAGRRLWGDGAGLSAALLAVFSPWHLYLSQYARYYSLAFLLAAITIVAFWLAYREDSGPWLVAGVVSAGFGVLAHASAGMIFGAAAAWILVVTAWEHLTGEDVPALRLAAAGVVGVGLVAASAFYFVPILLGWSAHPARYGFAGPVLFLSFGQWLTAGTSLFAVGGSAWMWAAGERKKVSYLLAVVALPFLFLSVAGYFIKVSVPFLFVSAPAVFLLAGYFVHRVYVDLRSGAVAPAVAAAVVLLAGIATGVPSFVSHYMDGSRPDFRSAANWLEGHVDAGDDVVLTDLKNALERYLDVEVDARGFDRSVRQLEEVVDEVAAGPSPGVVWVTPWIADRGGFNERGLGPATGWVRRHCVLRRVVSHPRLDFRRNEVHVYRCGGDPGRGASRRGAKASQMGSSALRNRCVSAPLASSAVGRSRHEPPRRPFHTHSGGGPGAAAQARPLPLLPGR